MTARRQGRQDFGLAAGGSLRNPWRSWHRGGSRLSASLAQQGRARDVVGAALTPSASAFVWPLGSPVDGGEPALPRRGMIWIPPGTLVAGTPRERTPRVADEELPGESGRAVRVLHRRVRLPQRSRRNPQNRDDTRRGDGALHWTGQAVVHRARVGARVQGTERTRSTSTAIRIAPRNARWGFREDSRRAGCVLLVRAHSACTTCTAVLGSGRRASGAEGATRKSVPPVAATPRRVSWPDDARTRWRSHQHRDGRI